MDQLAPTANQFADMLSDRLVRYGELIPCTTAFIDTRTPGHLEKENFTIIGPGVAENPDQHVHISTPHGFNIGGARQPPGCTNSQHSHETAEVFVVHKGTWAFYLGPECEDGEVVLHPGDTISIPTRVFRGFKNVGSDVGYLYAVLGGDDPGHVTWAPEVFGEAAKYGLILLDDGSLVDTTKGETIPEGKAAMRATTAEDAATLRTVTADEMADCVVRRNELMMDAPPGRRTGGVAEYPIIGTASQGEGLDAGKMAWSHGFQLRYITVDPGTSGEKHVRAEEEVVFVHDGVLRISFDGGDVDLEPGDVLSVPIGIPRAFSNAGNELAKAYVARGGDSPQPPRLAD